MYLILTIIKTIVVGLNALYYCRRKLFYIGFKYTIGMRIITSPCYHPPCEQFRDILNISSSMHTLGLLHPQYANAGMYDDQFLIVTVHPGI